MERLKATVNFDFRYHGSLRRGSNVSLHDDDVYAGSLRGLGHMGKYKFSKNNICGTILSKTADCCNI